MMPLRQRTIDDMRIRNFATITQRSYIHYVAEYAKHFHRSAGDLDMEAVRQYQLYLSQERKLFSQSFINFVSAVQFLYLKKLEMPWKEEDFVWVRVEAELPAPLSLAEVETFFDSLNGLEKRAVLLTCYWRRTSHLRGGFQRIRYYGFLANCHLAAQLALCPTRWLLPIQTCYPEPADYPNSPCLNGPISGCWVECLPVRKPMRLTWRIA